MRASEPTGSPASSPGWRSATPVPTAASGVETQTFVLSAEAWLDHGWRAPGALAEQLSRELHTLRVRGEAIGAAVDAHRHGVPWHLAASTSYGNGALSRAAAVGAVHAGLPAAVSLAASLDTVVTHADRRAVAASATLATAMAALIRRDPSTSPVDIVGAVGPATGGVLAPQTLALALRCAVEHDDPSAAVAAAVATEGLAAGAITGALVGAIHGAAALPPAWRNVEGAAAYPMLARRIAASTDQGSDIWFLIDRSGSMASIARDVVDGFDQFFASQRSTAGDATVTVVQFDDHDPHDVLVDAAPLARVHSIAERFEPRGSTPLYDAVGLLLDRAERRDGDDADQLVVILTDGGENASRHWTQRKLFARISDLRDRGWTFVFLGANQDSYATGGSVGFQAGNVSNFEASPMGVQAAYSGLDRTVAEWRGKDRDARRRDKDAFWGGRKEGEGQ